ncbi:MAG: hypothetical protein KF861_17785, partial [Planctomycetaceae bacterium]|nr:hypothetical protein [Planctomycetaceae bacterium]
MELPSGEGSGDGPSVPLAPFGRVDPINRSDDGVPQAVPAPNVAQTPPLSIQSQEQQAGSAPASGAPDGRARQSSVDEQELKPQDWDSVVGFSARDLQEGPPRRGALLSLSLDAVMPRDMRETPFRSLGTSAIADAPALDVRYASRSHRDLTTWIVASGVMLFLWWLRGGAPASRLVLALLTVIVPLALLSVVPAAVSMLVEGVLLGGLGGVLLWGVRYLASQCQSTVSRVRQSNTAAPVVAGLLMSIIITGPSVTLAEENHSAPPPAVESAHKERSKVSEPTVVVPYGEEGPLAADRVLLPRELFEKLRLQADPDAGPSGPSPVDGVVAEAEYVAQVGGVEGADNASSQLSLSARFVIHNFRRQPVVLTLPLKDVAVTAATWSDTAATVRPSGDGGLEVVVPTSGRHELKLTCQLAAELQNTSGEFVLSLRPVAAGRLQLTLPQRDDWSVSILRDGRERLGTQQQSESGRFTIETLIDRGGRLSVSWRPRQMTAARQGIVNVESLTAVQVDDEGVSIRTAFDVSVRQGELSELTFDFPDTLRLKRLWGPDVGGWRVENTSDDRKLTVFLRRTVSDQTRILADLFVLEAGTGDGVSFDVPAFAPRDVTREAGQIVLLAAGVRDVRADGVEGVMRTNALTGELPRELNPASLSPRGTFRFVARPWRLSTAASLQPEQARVTAEHGMRVSNRRVQLASRLQFDLTGAPRRLIRVRLPHDFVLVDLRGDEVQEWFVEEGELVLDLGEPRTGTLTVTFEGHIPRDSADMEVVLETPLPQDIQRQDTRLAIWVDRGLTLSLESFDGWRSLPRNELPKKLRELHEQEPQFTFRSAELEPELVIARVERSQPQITGDAVTLIAVSDASIDYGLTLRWTVERAVVDRLTLTTPDWLAGRLEFTGDGIERTTSQVLDDRRVRWTIELERPMLGEYLLSAVATLPVPADARVTAPDVEIVQPAAGADEFMPVTSQQSFAVLVNLSTWQITRAEGVAPTIVRTEQLPFSLRSELLAQAMEVVAVPTTDSLVWQLQPVTVDRTAAATVTSSDLTTVLATDGSWRTHASYRVRNRGQQFLAVRLPTGASLLSVLVKERPARALRTSIQNDAVVLVPLPQTSAADLSFVVQLVLQGVLPQPLGRARSLNSEHIALPAPTVVTPRQSREYGVPVVFTNWTVYLPEDFEAAPVKDGSLTNLQFHPAGASGAMSYLQDLQELSDLNYQL